MEARVGIGCSPLLLFVLLFEAGSLTEHKFHCFSETVWPASSQTLPVSTSAPQLEILQHSQGSELGLRLEQKQFIK